MSRPLSDVVLYFDWELMTPETMVLPLVTSDPDLIVVVGVPDTSKITTFRVVPEQTPIWGAFSLMLSGSQMNPVNCWVTIALLIALP